MRLLDVYIARQVALWALLALAVLVALSAVVTFVDDLDSVGQRNYGIREAIEFTILTLPRQAFVLFPFAAVIGTLVGLGALSASSELSVIRTSGVSSGRVVGSVLKGAALLVICAVLIGEVAAPYFERLGQSRRAALLAGPSERADGFWVRDGPALRQRHPPRLRRPDRGPVRLRARYRRRVAGRDVRGVRGISRLRMGSPGRAPERAVAAGHRGADRRARSLAGAIQARFLRARLGADGEASRYSPWLAISTTSGTIGSRPPSTSSRCGRRSCIRWLPA